RTPNVVEPELRTIVEVAPMADNRTMEELLQVPIEGYEEAIVIPEINAGHFEIKTNLLQLVHANPYHGFERENPHTHINNFKRITSTLKFTDVPNDVIKLMMFPYSLEGSTRVWYDKEPPNSILTWEDPPHLRVPSIPTNPSPKKIVKRETEETTDKEQTNFQGSTANIQPPVTLISEIDVSKNLPKPDIPYPSRLNDQKLHEKATNQIEKSLLTNKDKLFELTKIPLNENFSVMLLKKILENLGDPGKFLIPCDFSGMDVCHALTNLGASINLMPLSIWKKLSLPKLTPTRMTLKLADRSITRPKGVAKYVFVKVGKFYFPTDFVVVDFKADPRVPLILGRSCLRTGRALIDVYGEEITLRVMTKPEEYAQEILSFSNNSLGGNPTSTFEPIISNSSPSLTPSEGRDICLIEKLLNNDPFQLLPMDLKQREVVKAKSLIEEPSELELKDLSSHLENAYLEGVDKLSVIIAKDLKDNEKEDLLKVLKSQKKAIAWKITDVKGIDPRFCTHKILMKEDYKPAVQSQRRVNPKIHEIIKKEVIKLLDAGMIYPISNSPWVSPIHYVPKKGITVFENKNNKLIPTRLVTRWRVCIDYKKLNDATRKDHFPLPFMDQIMPFGLCNAPRTFQRCMMVIFHDMIEKTMEVFMGDFLIFGDSFSSCLSHLDIMFQRLEVDRAKVDVIAKLPHPTTVKGVRSFLGHAGFYRRFIQDFSKNARPVTHLLEKETPFMFSKDCIDAFETLKKKLTEASILVVPDWNLPFELMCDSSDFAIGVVLGQRKMKHFQPIHYASKTMTEAQINYTTTKKEMLAVVDEIPQNVIQVCEIFYVWGIDFIGPFPSLRGNRYILVAVDYLSKWVEAKVLPTNDARVVVKILKSLFPRFRTPRAIISNRGTHFCNDKFAKVMSKYGVTHRLATAYHPQTSGQVEVSNRGLKRILERTVRENRTSWFEKLEDALWAFRTTYMTDIGCTPYKLVYGKSCHLPIELEHKAYWALKHVNFDLKTMGDHRKLQLNELNELQDQAYKKSLIYKEKTKKIRDSKIKNRIFNVGDRVLLFNSRLKIFVRKLKTRWSGPLPSPKFFHMEPLSYLNQMVQTLSDFLLEEVDAFLALEDDPTSPEVDQSYVDTGVDIILLESFLNDDPSLPPPNP
nr:reverse transcriptase domain-containing protein [Tanacetum cinerariifolium]